MFTFDVFWGRLGTDIFGNSRSAANDIGTRLPSYDYDFIRAIVIYFCIKKNVPKKLCN